MKKNLIQSIAKGLGVLLFVVSPLSAQVFTGLGGPLAGGDGTAPVDISANGQVIAGNNLSETSFPGPDIQAFRWESGTGLTGLGVPAGALTSFAQHVSQDGRVIAGGCDFPISGGDPRAFMTEAFRWTMQGGFVLVPVLPGGTSNSIAGLSANGFVLTGSGDSSAGFQAFRWTQKTGTVGLGFLPGENYSQSEGISADGSVIVGESGNGEKIEAFRWTESDGMESLGFLPNSTENDQIAVSANGRVVIGTGVIGSDPSAQSFEAFRWTGSGGIMGLGFLPGENYSRADKVSASGAVIAGVGKPDAFSTSSQAFRWTRAGGMVGLGYLPGGGSYSYVESMVPDGSILAGSSDSANGVIQAFLWTESGGMRSVQDILTNDYGVDLTGWTLRTALISADGKTLTGEGINPSGQNEAWVAYLSNGSPAATPGQ